MTSCCGFTCGMGCNGGWPSGAWNYIKSTGVVTGGEYGDDSWCYSYVLPKCDHHVDGPYGPCGDVKGTPDCRKSCDNGASWNEDKHKSVSSYSVSSSKIQEEILTKGPVEAG